MLWLTTTGYTQPSTLNLADAKTMIDEDKPAGGAHRAHERSEGSKMFLDDI